MQLTIFGLAKQLRTSDNIYAVISVVKPKANRGRIFVARIAPHFVIIALIDARLSRSRHESRKQNLNRNIVQTSIDPICSLNSREFSLSVPNLNSFFITKSIKVCR